MFYTYDQNNSGGSFTGPAQYVIVEAKNAKYANFTAEEELGLYFDGDGDCHCCGNRWSEQWSDADGTIVPEIYGMSLSKRKQVKGYFYETDKVPYTLIYYSNGTSTIYKSVADFPDED